MGWVINATTRFTPERETRYSFYRGLGGPQGRSGRVRKISPPPGFDPQTAQPVASRYTDYAISAHLLYRVAHEKPARRLVDQRGRKSRTLYR